MKQWTKIQRISAMLRYVLIVAALVLAVGVGLGFVTQGQDWVLLGDGQLSALWSEGSVSSVAFMSLVAPIAVLLILGVYWLQRLFGEYQAGHFFTHGTMRCYVWLVWLKAAGFVYNTALPYVLNVFVKSAEQDSLVTVVDAGTLIELIVLLLIVHVLKQAQAIYDENKAFI